MVATNFDFVIVSDHICSPHRVLKRTVRKKGIKSLFESAKKLCNVYVYVQDNDKKTGTHLSSSRLCLEKTAISGCIQNWQMMTNERRV